MVSHLTAPFMQADGYGAISQLHEKLEHYEVAENPMLKSEYAKSIVEIATREHFDRDLKLSADFAAGRLNEEDLGRLHNFLHEIQDAKVNRGMYVIGRPYSGAEADETARLALTQLPKLRGCQVHTSVMLSPVDIKIFQFVLFT